MDDNISRKAAIEAVKGTRPIMAVDGTTAYRPDAIVEALTALPAVGGWLDIESALADGHNAVIAWREGWVRPKSVTWSSGYWWTNNERIMTTSGLLYMPIPAPPEE